MPTPSCPGTNGGVGLTGQSPCAAWMSVWQSPLLSILTRTCPGPGAGTGRSSIVSGLVKSVTTAAFMHVSPVCRSSQTVARGAVSAGVSDSGLDASGTTDYGRLRPLQDRGGHGVFPEPVARVRRAPADDDQLVGAKAALDGLIDRAVLEPDRDVDVGIRFGDPGHEPEISGRGGGACPSARSDAANRSRVGPCRRARCARASRARTPGGTQTRSPAATRGCRRRRPRSPTWRTVRSTGGTRRTGHAACLATAGTDRAEHRCRRPPRPCDPITIRYASADSAASTSLGSPVTLAAWTSISGQVSCARSAASFTDVRGVVPPSPTWTIDEGPPLQARLPRGPGHGAEACSDRRRPPRSRRSGSHSCSCASLVVRSPCNQRLSALGRGTKDPAGLRDRRCRALGREQAGSGPLLVFRGPPSSGGTLGPSGRDLGPCHGDGAVECCPGPAVSGRGTRC